MKLPSYVFITAAVFTLFVTGIQPAFSDDSDEYEKILTRGQRQLKARDFEAATASFTAVLRDYPNVYEAYLMRAESRIGLKDLDGALKDYDQAIKINPNVVEAYFKRGELKESQGNQKEAIDDYTQALSLNPKDVRATLLLANALKKNGDNAKAGDVYANAMKLDANSIQARRDHAFCKMKVNDYDGAIEDYNYLLRKYKTQAFSVHYDLAQALLMKGDKDGARDQFNQIVAYYSKTISRSQPKGEDYLKRGLAYFELGEQQNAVSDLEKAVSLLPGDANARCQLGHARLVGDDTAGAIKDLNEALKLDSKLTQGYFDRGSAHLSEGDFAAAKIDLDSALSVEKNAQGYLNRALARLGLGDTSNALKDVIEAKKIDPKTIDAKQRQISDLLAKAGSSDAKDLLTAQYLEQLALLDLADNKLDSAETFIKRAIVIQEQKLSEADPRRAISLMLLGNVNLERRSMLKAEALFRSALARLHNNPDAAKYAVFNLEECAKVLLRSSSYEQAGSILSDTRLERSARGIHEPVLTGDLSRQADHALDVYRQKRRQEQQTSLTASVERNKIEAQQVATTVATPAKKDERPIVKRIIETPVRDKWAVIIGISAFKDPNINLHFAAKDAQDFYDFLVKEKNFAPDHVQLLTDSLATRANILSVLGNKWLPRVAEPNDLVVIYFSTHGSPSSLDVGGVNYLVAHDTDVNDLYATGIAMQDLARIIKARVHSDRVMLVLDACHSGGAAPSSKGLGRTGNIDVEQIMQGTGQMVISSSEPDQVSWESKRYSGSVFTRHLIEGLRANGQLTRLGNAFTILQSETQREVLRDRGILQTPVMKSQWEGTDLIIGAPPAAPSPGLREVVLPDIPKPTPVASHPKPRAKSGGKTMGSTSRGAR